MIFKFTLSDPPQNSLNGAVSYVQC